MFDIFNKTIGEHISNVFQEGELAKKAVVRDFRTTAADGKTYRINYCNLNVITSVSYRVKSERGTSFRQWATPMLRQHFVQGYVLNEMRLRESARQLARLKRLVQLQAEVTASQELTIECAAAYAGRLRPHLRRARPI
ncbi:MAG: RhuM family protein [Janthinobacterium lividum]